LSFKRLFSRTLAAAPGRLHMAAHSHHLWPDASFAGQVQCWDDAARLADAKWDKVMGEVWPEAQGHVARELGTGRADAIAFASNTHELLLRIVAAAPRRGSAGPLRILTSSGEFHSARRQFARWQEAGDCVVSQVDSAPFGDFSDRFLAAASQRSHDLIFVSQVMFASGQLFDAINPLARLAAPGGPWVVIDGYHAFMALDRPFGGSAPASAFYLGGGYKYAMAGEGCAFLHAPPGFGLRPPITGWYAEFEDLSLAPGQVGYAPDARRFLGATFDPSGLYRFNAVQRMLKAEGLDTPLISAHVAALQTQLLGAIAGTPLGRAELLNPPVQQERARFLSFRSPDAQRWCAQLRQENCITDVRGDVLRIGLGLYHDPADVDRFAELAAKLA
jgi:selenocysteine lyase/cysteine desulfurase